MEADIFRTLKVDIHVHSRHSNKPTIWALRKFHCPESYTEPSFIYQRARSAGMGLVTIADHNTIHGALEIAHLPGAFISVEVTAYFPEDGCKVHVVVVHITEAVFGDLMRLRKNIYELIGYLRSNRIVHFIAHPLYAQNDKLTACHIEKMLLLFDTFEVINGSRAGRFHRLITAMLDHLSPELIADLAEKHRLEPYGATPWEKGRVGGSDDHSGLFIGHTYTEVDGVETADALCCAIRERRCRAGGHHGGALTLAHSLYGIGYRYYRERLSSHRAPSSPFINLLLNRTFSPGEDRLPLRERCRLFVHRVLSFSRNGQQKKSFEKVLDLEVERLFRDKDFLARMQQEEQNRRIFTTTSYLANRVIYIFTERLLNQSFEDGTGLLDLIHSMSAIGLVHLLVSPYYLAFHHQHRSKDLMAELKLRLALPPVPDDRQRQAVFTDLSVDPLRGRRDTGEQDGLLLFASAETTGATAAGMNFQAVGELSLPWQPQQKLSFPPLLDVIEFFERENFTSIHIRTPGPMGLVALLVGKLLHVPMTATFGQDFSQVIGDQTGDEAMQNLVWNYLAWFYQQMQQVEVTSPELHERLLECGLPAEKLAVGYPQQKVI